MDLEQARIIIDDLAGEEGLVGLDEVFRSPSMTSKEAFEKASGLSWEEIVANLRNEDISILSQELKTVTPLNAFVIGWIRRVGNILVSRNTEQIGIGQNNILTSNTLIVPSEG